MPTVTATPFASLYVECVGGVAGDMLLAALVDLGADVDTLRRSLESLHQVGLALDVEGVTVAGERALHVRSLADDTAHHRTLADILTLIDASDISMAARRRAHAIFGLMAAAEATVHGETVDAVHLHEAGALDSVMDVVGIAIALDFLGNPQITASPVPSGRGSVQTSHGNLALPVPAVVEIARRYDVPLVEVRASGETVTPTGIAVLAEACGRYTATAPPGAVAVGIGAGTRRFADRPNVVRVHGFA